MLAVTKSVPVGALSRVTGLRLSAFRSSIVKTNGRKTKIKVFYSGNSDEKKITQRAKGNSKRKQAQRLKRGKTRATKLLVLHVTGRVSDASFLDQSQNKVNQNQCTPKLVSTLSKKIAPLCKTSFSLSNSQASFRHEGLNRNI